MLLYLEWKTIEDEISRSKEKFKENNEKLASLKKKIDLTEAKKNSMLLRIDKINSELNKFNLELQSKSAERNNLFNEKNIFKNRKKEIEYFLQTLKKDKELEKNRLDEFNKNIDKVDFITKEYFEVQENVSKAVVFLSFKKPEFNNERLREIYALDLFIEIMDGGYSSRLTNNLVNSEKIALDTFISNDTYNQHSNLIIIGGTPRGDTSTEYFKKQILNQFSSDSINTIKDKEQSKAKARIKPNNVFKFDSVFYQAMQVGMLETKNISWKELDKYNSITESITLNEVKAAGKKFISDQSPLVTILNPKK